MGMAASPPPCSEPTGAAPSREYAGTRVARRGGTTSPPYIISSRVGRRRGTANSPCGEELPWDMRLASASHSAPSSCEASTCSGSGSGECSAGTSETRSGADAGASGAAEPDTGTSGADGRGPKPIDIGSKPRGATPASNGLAGPDDTRFPRGAIPGIPGGIGMPPGFAAPPST